ncbi:hypothetical protein HPB49_005689 [Dermacentor silvarum]|uniref:Uncharacterized protein n=1 Tax=Dermacentor silvarum TaxID=543639 RepID=A0ACB8D383_DERSI|nr:hypothetical protein HPB49_005689 [Dermacentor silvarum]
MVKAMGIHAIITDRCWTLPPLSALAALLAVLLSKNSAVFYVAFMNEFGVSHESASWPIAVCTVSVQFSGLLVSYLEKRLSIYHITIAGSLLNFVALIAASFAPNITWMSITFGVLSGAGQGIIVVTLSIYAMLYFDKYRAAASGFKYTGISLAPFFSMLLSLSIQQDGLHEVLRLFKNPILYLLVATFGLTDYVSSTFETTVLDYAVDKGATKSQALPIISYVAAAEIVGRLTLPFLWDSMRLSRSLLVALCLLGASVGLLAMPHATSFSHVIATAVTTGITTGCVTAMKPVLLSDSLGVDNLSFCWGIAGVLALPLHLGGPMLIDFRTQTRKR